jgi:DNA repair exonuclease SbcCD nuclease subunit
VKPIAIAFSDLHIEDWKSYSKDHSRFKYITKFLNFIFIKASDYNIPILFAGDLFENSKYLSNYILNHFLEPFHQHDPIFIAIAGNHDQSELNTNENISPNYISFLKTVTNSTTYLDKSGVYLDSHNIYVHGIPYISGNKGYGQMVDEANRKAITYKGNHVCRTILMIHSDVTGAVNTSGFTYDGVEGIPKNTREFFHGFDLVLNGHIHKPQKIGKIQILGSVYQQKINDMGTDMGYWLIYPDLSLKFKKAKFPEFKEGEPEDDYNFYIKKKKKITLTQNKYDFDRNLDRTKLAKNYLKAINVKDSFKLKLLIKYLNDTV